MTPSTLLFTSILAAAIPTLIYVLLIYWIDRYEKEPLWLLASAFFWGAVPSILLAFVLNAVLSTPFYWFANEGAADTLSASLVAPPVEETLKGLALLAILLLWRHEIDSPLDGIIYGAMVGMGFAMVENVYYFVTVYNEGGLEAWGMNVFLRGAVFGLNHAMFSSMTGLGIALARMSPNMLRRFMAPFLGWSMAVFMHFFHNLTVSTGNLLCIIGLFSDWGGVLLTLGIAVWALLQERSWLKQYLVEEVGAQTLTLSQYENASSGRKRSKHLLSVLTSRGVKAYRQTRRFYLGCSELAYKKHHQSIFHTEKNQELVLKARSEVARLSRQAT